MLLSGEALLSELDFLGFPEDLTALLLAASAEIDARPDLRASYDATVQALLAGEPLPDLNDPTHPTHPLMELLVAVGQLPQARARHRELGIPQATSRSAFDDLLRLSRTHRQRTGEWGFTSLSWVKWHLRSQLFELGRLQFQFATFQDPYRIYRHRDGTKLIAFAQGGITANADGIPFADAGADGAEVFVTTFEEAEGSLTAHPVDLERGTICRTPARHSLEDYELFLQPDDPALAIHIAIGQRLDPAACDASLQEAADFFPRYFPDFRWRVFRCFSWLLDPALEVVAKPGANLSLFGKRFHRVPRVPSNDDQLMERVFGKGVDPFTVAPLNSLQAAVIAHLRAGGRFRTTSGFIPRPEY